MSEPGILPQPIPFGKYYLLERINVGGMAEVYKAKAFGVQGFERLLAVKKILSSIAEDEAFIEMFVDEAKIAGQLSHPNIAQIFDLGKVDGSYFIALEYIGGKDLKTIFERARRIGEKVSIPRVCYIIMKVCEGLAHAHHKKDAQGQDLNIVHRDISPQNILLSYEGEVKIIDFGIAKAQGKTSQTQVGILKGKFSYMSPEQVRGLHMDHRSDLFSLAIVLYEMLTLERLFLGESDFDTLEKIRKVEMSPPSLYNPHIPKELEDIVLKGLGKSPDERFQTSYEFADALERFMRNQGYYYTNKDLAQYMKEAFNADIEFENKKFEYYKSLNLRPLDGSQSVLTTRPNGIGKELPRSAEAGLSWGEEEMETQIFDRIEDSNEIDDADIVYAKDANATDEVPTVEYDRWKSDLEFKDEPAEPRLRPSQPTAQLPSVEPRRHQSHTLQGIPSPVKKKNNSMAVIAIVALLVVVAGVIGQRLLAKAELQIETEPESVEVWINGEKVHDGPTPFVWNVKPGQATIELKKEGFVPFKLTEKLNAQTYKLNETLEPMVRSAEIMVKTDPPGATIEIDGRKLEDPSPFTIKDLQAAKASIKVSKEGYFEETREVALNTDRPNSLEIRLKPERVSLKVTSVPDRAEYTVYDGETRIAAGRTPDTIKDLDATRKFRVVVERRLYDSWERVFEPAFEKEATLEASLRRQGDDESKTVATTSRVTRPDPTPTRVNIKNVKKPEDTVKPPPEKTTKPPEKKPEEVAGTGILNIASKPVARVYIDDQDTGRYTPILNFKIKSGKHKITLKNPEFSLDKTYYVDVGPGETKKIINR